VSEKNYHLIGVGGAGMSALARILIARGDHVSGSDLQDSRAVRDLQALGARVHVGHRKENLNGADVVVQSAAIRRENPEVVSARERKIPILSRAELLGEVMRVPQSVAVTGTHGKSTTTGMLVSLLNRAGMNPTALLGADLAEIGGNAKAGRPDLVVAEVCEAYDSFLSVFPGYAILTNIEPDHLDYFGTMDRLLQSFRQFVGQVRPEGGLIGCGDDPRIRDLMRDYPGEKVTYGFERENDLRAEDVRLSPGSAAFVLHEGGSVVGEVVLSVSGRHNVLNAMGAMAAARLLGVSWDDAIQGIRAFHGVGRRMEWVGEGGGVSVCDDYAHHPTEIRATLATLRESYQPKRLIALFQPHLYSRTVQFLDEFATSFDQADLALLMDIYGSRESPMEGVTSQLLLDKMSELRPEMKAECVGGHASAVYRVLSLIEPGDIVVCLGAGDITATAREIGYRAGSPMLLSEARE
jgi:UDP-N-acetylmuramate--alanine ligase